MDKQKTVFFIWTCLTIVLVSMFVLSAFLETVKVYKLSGGTTISLYMGGLVEFALVLVVYFLTKLLIGENKNGQGKEREEKQKGEKERKTA